MFELGRRTEKMDDARSINDQTAHVAQLNAYWVLWDKFTS